MLLIDKPIVIQGSSFKLDLSHLSDSSDTFLILDIYSKNDGLEQHCFWFSYDFLEGSSTQTDIENNITIPSVEIEDFLKEKIYNCNNLVHRDSWYDPSFTALPSEFEVRCVLRSKKDNAITQILTVYIISEKTNAKILDNYSNIQESILFHQHPIASKSKIAIISANLSRNDAMSNHSIRLSRLWQAHGGSCDHFVLNYKLDDLVCCRPFIYLEQLKQYSLIIFDYGCFTPGIEYIISNTNNIKKIIYFHGITPPKNSLIFATEIAFACKRGLDQLKRIIKLSFSQQNLSWGFNSITTKKQFKELVEEVKLESCRENSSYKMNDVQHETNGNQILDDSVVLQPLFDPNSVTSTNYQSERESEVSDLVLLSLGRLVPHKKCEYAIELATALIEVGLQIQLNFVYSSTITDYEKYLQSLASKYLPKDTYHFYKQLPPAELNKLWQKTSYCVHPSEHEGFGIVVRESIAHGVPVISSAISSVQDEQLSSVIYSDFSKSQNQATALLIKSISTNNSLKQELNSRIEADQKLIADNIVNSRVEWLKYLQINQ